MVTATHVVWLAWCSYN